MKKNKFLLLLFIFLVSCSNFLTQTVDWFKKYETNMNLTSIASKSSGDLITCSTFPNGPASFETYTLVGSGNLNFAICKIDASGNGSVIKQFNGNSEMVCYAMTTDASGNIISVGHFLGTAVFDTYTLTSPTSAGNDFICKINSSGTVQWVDTLDNSASTKFFQELCTDAAGNIFAVGEFSNAINVGNLSLLSSGGKDAFIVKYNASGSPQWLKKMGGSAGNETCFSVRVDQIGNIYTAGNFVGSCTFGPYFLNSSGNSDGYICKYTTGGNVLWCKKFGGTNYDIIKSVCTTYTNSLYMYGSYSNTTTIGTTTLSNYPGNHSNYVTRLDTSGNVIWVKQFGSSQPNHAMINSITSDASNALYSTGSFGGTVCFGSTSLSAACLTTQFADNSFISKLDLAGNFVWLNHVNGGNSNLGVNIIEDAGKLYIYGTSAFNSLSIDNFSLSVDNSSSYFIRMSSAPIGLKEYNNTRSSSFFPNPVNSKGKIKFEDLPKTENAVYLIDITGKQVYFNELREGDDFIELCDLIPGIYLLRLTTGSATILTKKIVVE